MSELVFPLARIFVGLRRSVALASSNHSNVYRGHAIQALRRLSTAGASEAERRLSSRPVEDLTPAFLDELETLVFGAPVASLGYFPAAAKPEARIAAAIAVLGDDRRPGDFDDWQAVTTEALAILVGKGESDILLVLEGACRLLEATIRSGDLPDTISGPIVRARSALITAIGGAVLEGPYLSPGRDD